MPKTIDLVASYFTIAGDVYPHGPHEVSPWDFRSRVEAAAAAGFRGFGLVHADLMAVSARTGLPLMRSILADNGLRHVELEMLGDWYAEGDRRAESDRVRADLMRAAEALGARHIKVGGDVGGPRWPIDRLSESFAALCADAAAVGTAIVLEPMPFTNIATIDDGLEIVRGAGATNGGLLLDVWHLYRGGTSYSRIADVPREILSYVEVDDADAEQVGTMLEDTLHNRRLCGEGDVDVPAFLRAIRDASYAGPYGVEILSRELRRRPPAEAAALAFSTAMRQFDAIADPVA